MKTKAKASPVLEARGVVKSFGAVRAVRGVDLQVHAGEAVALLGPNGAGKTTLVELLEGLQAPDAGEITVFGKPWRGHEHELRSRLGVSLQETEMVDKLSVEETLQLFASFYGLGQERVEAVLDAVSLNEKRKAWTSKLSGGQKQRLALGLGLLHNPELLILDEPTTGLDPKARREVWSLVSGLKKQGMTLLLTTHYMEEAEELCQRVVFLSHGQTLMDAPMAQAKRKHGNLERLFTRLSGESLND